MLCIICNNNITTEEAEDPDLLASDLGGPFDFPAAGSEGPGQVIN